MKKHLLSHLIIFPLLLLTGVLQAAPLFPDLPDDHWASDAVAELAAKGLVEGYPDGTFKGDRSASRWELALMVARLLGKLDSEPARFASKAERDQIHKLASALPEELDALGVRVGALEEGTTRLDDRVSELERITFYGSLDTRVVFQSFNNDGAQDNDSNRMGAGVPGTVPYLNYGSAVGTGAPVPWRPQVVGILPVVDYRLGRGLSSGTGFTSLAILGLNLKVTPEIDAGVEFAGFSAQGDNIVDGYWGVSAPYLSNIFTANVGTDQSLANTPFTRMTLNRFWVEHKPSKTKLVVGNIPETTMDPLIYAGQGNLGVFGPKRWPGFGFDVSGESEVGSDQSLSWEVLGNRFGDGVRFDDTNYQNYVLSGHLDYDFLRGGVGLDFSRMAEEAPPGGQPLSVGLDSKINVAYGASNGWSIRQWVNTPGHFANQRSAQEQAQTARVGNTADTRPIAGWNPTQDNAIGYGLGAGNFGPEAQTVWGLNGHYEIPFNAGNKLALRAKFGHSNFKPNRNSSYNSDGTAIILDVDAYLLDGALDIGGTYLRVEPNYAPAAWSGNLLGGRPVKPFNFTGVGHLYDSGTYPQNREGLRLYGNWHFDEKRGKVWAKGSLLQQTNTSLYDVRVTNSALAPTIPTNDVIGFSPGFVDTVFFGFAHPNIYGSQSRNSFTTDLTPLENPRGYERFVELGATHRWDTLGLVLTGSASRNLLRRDSHLSGALGGSQNEVDITVDSLAVELGFDVNSKMTLNGGLDYIQASGHYDPSGLYNAYALSSGSTNFTNIDSYQVIPHLEFDYDLNEKTTWNITGRHYGTHDKVDQNIQTGNNALGQIGSSTHPFSWSGWQVSSEFKLAF